MLIQDNTVLEGKLPHFGGQTTHSPENTRREQRCQIEQVWGRCIQLPRSGHPPVPKLGPIIRSELILRRVNRHPSRGVVYKLGPNLVNFVYTFRTHIEYTPELYTTRPNLLDLASLLATGAFLPLKTSQITALARQSEAQGHTTPHTAQTAAFGVIQVLGGRGGYSKKSSSCPTGISARFL